jgi:Phage terminase large subunit (GpA)
MSLITKHLAAVSDGARDVYSLNNLSTWIEKYVYLEGKRMDMSGNYVFQKHIVNNTSRVVNTLKSAQIGLTTVTQAYLLAALATQKKCNVIYALPSASDAAKITTTKLNPLIYGSPQLKALISSETDSVELKKIGNNFLFTRGSKSETAALSISADILVVDELDRCDPDTVKQFRSRLQASQLGLIKQFSTPTITGVGISKEAEASKRYRSFATCTHCGHKWLPDYSLDMRVPGYGKDLSELDKHNIIDTNWRDAYWSCRKCGKDPQMTAQNVEWVCENPEQNYEASTYYVGPIACNQVLRPAYIVRTSTEFATRAEWKNQVLGIEAEDSNEQITAQDVDKALVQADLASSDTTFFGADIGLTCHVSITRFTSDGTMLVVHREAVPVAIFLEKRAELIRKYRCVVSVHDAFPYTPLISSITDFDPNAYGADFNIGKSVELFTVKQQEPDAEAGKLNLRLVKINRTRAFDELMELFKKSKIVIAKGQDDDKLKSHILSMKRVQGFRGDEMVYVWEKTSGDDHYFFAMMYSYIAYRLRGTYTGAFGSIGSLVSKFKVKYNGQT